MQTCVRYCLYVCVHVYMPPSPLPLHPLPAQGAWTPCLRNSTARVNSLVYLRREGGRIWNVQSVVARMIEDVVVGEIEIGIERGGVVLEVDQIHDRIVGGEVAGTQRSNSN